MSAEDLQTWAIGWIRWRLHLGVSVETIAEDLKGCLKPEEIFFCVTAARILLAAVHLRC